MVEGAGAIARPIWPVAAVSVKCDTTQVDGVDFIKRRLLIVTYAGMAVFVFVAIVWEQIYREAPISQSVADGLYVSPLCGPVTMSNGLLTFPGGQIRYRLEMGKTDLTVRAQPGVTVDRNKRIVVATDRPSSGITFWRAPYHTNQMNLYDARRVPPNRLTVWGYENENCDLIRVERNPPGQSSP